MVKTAEIVIIGGGIIGLSIGYYLGKAKAGRVLLLEKELVGQGSTGKTVGGIRSQFSTEINIRFSMESRKTFDNFYEEFGVDPEFKQVGYLFLATTASERDAFQKNIALQRRFGIPSELLEPEEIAARWPFLRSDDLFGASFCPTDGYAGPYEVVQGFLKGAKRCGVMIMENTEVIAIGLRDGRVTSVETAAGRVETRIVVNAAGPYASVIARMVGLELPVRPYRRQIFVTDTFEYIPREVPLTIDPKMNWYFRREGAAVLIAGPIDAEPSFRTHTDFYAMEEAARNAIHRVPVLQKARIARGWAGLYSMTPDSHAIVGWAPQIEGMVLANGFSGHGFQHAPATGKVISELILEGRARSIDISPLRPERFVEGQLAKETLTTFKG